MHSIWCTNKNLKNIILLLSCDNTVYYNYVIAIHLHNVAMLQTINLSLIGWYRGHQHKNAAFCKNLIKMSVVTEKRNTITKQ